MTEFPHPTTATLSREEVAAGFHRVVHESIPDGNWHFSLALPKTAQLGRQQPLTPSANGQLLSIAFFHLPQPQADIEIYGTPLDLEMDPADFLDLWLQTTGIITLSRKRIPSIGGAAGDVVVSWHTDGVEFAGRCFCLKFGSRLILVWCRCAAADYAALADTFFLAISTFRMATEAQGPLAQRVQFLTSAVPTAWKLALPINWTPQQEPPAPRVAGFQAAWLQPDSGQTILAKLSCAVVGPELATSANDAFTRAQRAFSQAGITFETPSTTSEPPLNGYLAGWYRLAAAQVNQNPAEYRCRVLQHQAFWLVAAVLSPALHVSPPAWMHAKRVLDIVTSTVELGV